MISVDVKRTKSIKGDVIVPIAVHRGVKNIALLSIQPGGIMLGVRFRF